MIDNIEKEKSKIEKENERLKFEVSLMRDAYFQLKRTASDLSDSESRYKVLFNAVSDAIFVLEVSTDASACRFVEVNNAACNLLGYTKEELITQSPHGVFVTEKEGDFPERLFEKENSTINQVLRLKDGGSLSAEIHVRTFMWKGMVSVIIVVRETCEC